jgi:5-methylcytosine-specific restriction protein A
MKIVAAAIIRRDTSFLVARRSEGQKLAGFWEFPGGKLEARETLQACIERELLEELGVRSVAGPVLVESHYEYEHGEILLKAIDTRLVDENFTLSVHDEVCWLSAHQILRLNLAPADIPIAEFLLRNQMKFDPTIPRGQIVDNEQLCSIFKCSPQGGMRRSLKTNTLVLVSNHVASIYDDRWIGDVFHYTGMGQLGDQSLEASQNKTLAQSATNGVAVHLFEVDRDGEYRYQGRVQLADKPYQETQPDQNDQPRQVWVFPLRLDEGHPTPLSEGEFLSVQTSRERKARRLNDQELTKRALKAPSLAGQRTVISKQYERSPYVSLHAKRRAHGRCELCQTEAPFLDARGEPYLETHHVDWLARGGSDSLTNTVALCPNCHRKMHVVDDPEERERLKKVAASSVEIDTGGSSAA